MGAGCAERFTSSSARGPGRNSLGLLSRPTQNTRHGVKLLIQIWCEQHRDKWPKDGETIPIDLDEVQVAGQARSAEAR